MKEEGSTSQWKLTFCEEVVHVLGEVPEQLELLLQRQRDVLLPVIARYLVVGRHVFHSSAMEFVFCSSETIVLPSTERN